MRKVYVCLLIVMLMVSACFAKPAPPIWGTATWTADDSSLLAAESTYLNRTKGLNDGQTLDVVNEYKFNATTKSQDSTARYISAFALEDYVQRFREEYNSSDYAALLPALEHSAQPHSYRYTRMLFIVAVRANSDVEALFPVGQRLLRRNPNDYNVLRTFPETVDYKQPVQRTAAIQAALRGRKLRPNYIGTLHMLAYVNGASWKATHDRAYGIKAVAYFQQLARTPKIPKRAKNYFLWSVETLNRQMKKTQTTAPSKSR